MYSFTFYIMLLDKVDYFFENIFDNFKYIYYYILFQK